jgi:hypothetical protein
MQNFKKFTAQQINFHNPCYDTSSVLGADEHDLLSILETKRPFNDYMWLFSKMDLMSEKAFLKMCESVARKYEHMNYVAASKKDIDEALEKINSSDEAISKEGKEQLKKIALSFNPLPKDLEPKLEAMKEAFLHAAENDYLY